MHNPLPVLFAIGLVLAVVTLVGHGIWALLAWLFGAGTKKSDGPGYKCPICRHELPAAAHRCESCGQPVDTRLLAELADLDAVERQLRRFEATGAMKPDAVAKLLNRVRNYRQRLVALRPVEKPRAAPIIATVVERPAPPPRVQKPAPAPIQPLAAAREVAPQYPKPRPSPVVEEGGQSHFRSGENWDSPQPAPPAKTWAEVLAGFMEERNIRWAEFVGVLVGGLMIVGASLALVISFWDTLQTTYLKFLVFVGYSSAVFGVGLFAYHRWKLHSTGRGLLTISTLLVPLNFVAMASLSPESWGWQTATAELISLAIFAWLSALAADVIVPGRRWSIVLAVVGNSALILLGARLLAHNESATLLLTASCVPVILLAVAMVGGWHGQLGDCPNFRGHRGEAVVDENGTVPLIRSTLRRLDAADAAANFTLLGMAVFAAAVAIGIVVANGGAGLYLPIRLHCLAPALALAAWPILACGLQIMRGMARRQELEAYRTAGIMTALVGVALQLTALALMWPQPLGLVIVGLTNAAGLFYVAVRHRFPVAHVGAIACLAVAWLAGFQLAANDWLRELQYGTLIIYHPGLAWSLLRSTLSARSITSLAGLFLVFSGIAAWLASRGRIRHAAPYAIACGVTAVIALLAITMRGITGIYADRLYAVADFAFYGAAAVLVSFRARRTIFSYIGWNLLGIAPFWALQTPLFAAPQTTLALAGCLLWLAAIWLLLAWMHRSRDILMAGQCLLTLATAVAATAWLQTQSWVTDLPRDLLDVRSLQTYGIALALLSLGWIVVRIAMRGKPIAERLLCSEEPTVDWVVRHAVVVCQMLLAVVYVAPGVANELWPSLVGASGRDLPLSVSGPAGWILLGTLAIVLIAALWERWGRAELVGSILLMATAPCLLAGRFADDVATASMLRWAMAGCFAACSVFVWQRQRLAVWCGRAGARVNLNIDGPRIARATLLATTAMPVIVLTLIAAWLQLASVMPGGPAADSFFDRLGPNLSYLVPLVLVIVSLVGYAVREKSSGYAFSAGLVAEMAAALGYALSVALDPNPARTFGPREVVTLIQYVTIAASVWAIAWLVARRWIDVWREDGTQADGSTPATLMDLQVGIGYVGNAIILAGALWMLIVTHPDRPLALTSAAFLWPVTAGMPLGWIAFVLAAAAGVYRRLQCGMRPSADAVGLLGMGVIALLACSVRGLVLADGSPIDPNWAYRVLMLGWASYAVLLTLATWPTSGAAGTVPIFAGAAAEPWQVKMGLSPFAARAAVNWVRLAAIAAVLLGLKAAIFHGLEERLWAAGTIALASVAGAAMAICRRREGWALASALGVNLAASLVVWYVEQSRGLTFDQWCLELLQANIIASSVVALVWLAARRWLYEAREVTVGGSPFLAVQIALPVAANVALLLTLVARLLRTPSCLPPQFGEIGDAWGWAALLLCAAAAAWYLWRTMPEQLPHVLGGLLLGIGVLVACNTAHINTPTARDWLEYHVLTMAWASAALVLLGIGFLSRWPRGSWSIVWRKAAGCDKTLAEDVDLSSSTVLLSRWVTSVAALTVVLAMIYSPIDRTGVWWSLRAIGAMGVATAILAVWRRLPSHVFFSGLLWNAAGVVAWLAWGNRHDPAQFVQVNVVCLAGASLVWTALQLIVPSGVPRYRLERRNVVFAHYAAALGLIAMALMAASGVSGILLHVASHPAVTRLAWIALASVAAALVLTLWDRLARLVLCGLYVAGFTALAMVWESLAPAPRALCWRMSTELSGYLLIAAVFSWLIINGTRLWHFLRIPMDADRWSGRWFMYCQGVLAAATAGVAAWVAIDFAFDGIGRDAAIMGLSGRMAGMAGALMLLGATIVMAWQSEHPWRFRWQCAALASGLLLNASTGWVAIDPTFGPASQAPWLHRSVSLLVAAAMMILVSSFGLGRVLPKTSDWIAAGRRAAPFFVGLTLLVLAAVLCQEVYLFDAGKGTPMATSAIAVVAATLALLVAICIALAVAPHAEKGAGPICRNGPEGAAHKLDLSPFPLTLSDSGRQAYIYAAEALVALVGLHLRMTVPWLFHLGIIERYWMFLMMAVAFAGAGLSEFFDRRRLPVLSRPLERTALLLPLLPAIGFWFAGDPTYVLGIMGRTPMLWLLMSAFYASMAYMRRLPACVALSVLTANVGLWVALHMSDIGLLEHPQLWLIPIALAVLVAEYLNHDRLAAAQSTALRYFALSVIYLSSTADMFIAGLGTDWRLPLLLMLLSVAGIFAGLFLRIRSFLLLGIVFLLLDIVSMIWHAAVDLEQTWLWWVCLIVVGAGIIALFAVFEKRRNDLLLAVEKLKQWQR